MRNCRAVNGVRRQPLFIMPGTLYLLDGMALAYRAHFAMINRPMFNSAGMNTSALFGFTNTLIQLIENSAREVETAPPTHMAVVYDTRKKTARHELYEEYKANRQEQPEDLAEALPRMDDLARAFRIPVIKKDGYEADDIIATLAQRAIQDGFDQVYMVTPDKDFGQVVTDKIRMYKPGYQGDGAEILGPKEVCEKWGIERVEQVIDILGLAGDSSDNIPGIPGVGPKTAQKLLSQFDSVEGVLENAGKLKGKQKEKVEENADQARLSKQLATIQTDVPIEIDWADLERKEYNQEELGRLFAEFDFKAIGKRILGKDFDPRKVPLPLSVTAKPQAAGGPAVQGELFSEEDTKTLDDVEHRYVLLGKNKTELNKFFKELKKQEAFCFDIETAGTNPRRAAIVGIAVSWEPREGYFAYFGNDNDEEYLSAVLDGLKPFFEDEMVEKIGHNLKFDLAVLRERGIEMAGPIFDTMLAHTLAEPDLRHGMDGLAQELLGYKPVPISQLIGEKGPEQRSMLEVDSELLKEYAVEDADVTLQLADKLRPILSDRNQKRVYYDIEAPLIPVLVDMEFHGITLDVSVLEEISKKLGKEIEKTQAQIFEMGGREINLNSPKQLAELLYEDLALIEKPRKTATGQYSTSEQVLMTLAHQHEIVARILDYREMVKLKNTYVDTLPETVDEKTGRVHTSYGQLHTVTGRLASSNPNLQNIPIRTELGREIRKAFVACDKDHLLLSADYSQIELRIIAALSQDEGMLGAFENGEDIHTATAARIYHITQSEVTREMRSKAKMVNFGIPYGISPYGLQMRLGIPRAEANEIINEYFNQFPGIRNYIDETLNFAHENGYVETVTGRRRYLRDINSRNRTTRGAAERNAINMPIQGTAADMIKIAMCGIYHELKTRGLRSRQLLQVHDELILEVPVKEKAEAAQLVREQMTGALELKAPIAVEHGFGANWLDAH